MISLSFNQIAGRDLKILCLGCHSDDIEIGCGGTLLRLREQYPNCAIQWVVFCANGVREAEASRGAELFAGTNCASVQLKHFRDGYLPFGGAAVKDFFEELKLSSEPDLVLTHTRHDAHQDHRLVNELTWNTFRSHFILEYEIPKYDGDLGQPSVYVTLSEQVADRKSKQIIDTFSSQRAKPWFEERTLLSLMRLRGMECNAPSGYAEAFYCRKLVFAS